MLNSNQGCVKSDQLRSFSKFKIDVKKKLRFSTPGELFSSFMQSPLDVIVRVVFTAVCSLSSPRNSSGILFLLSFECVKSNERCVFTGD